MSKYSLINYFDQGPYRVFQFKIGDGDLYFECSFHEDEFDGEKPSYEDVFDVVKEYFEDKVEPALTLRTEMVDYQSYELKED